MDSDPEKALGKIALAPGISGAALLNDLTILLFVADLAILLSPAR